MHPALASTSAEHDLQMLLGRLIVDSRLAERFGQDAVSAVEWAVQARGMRQLSPEAEVLLQAWSPHSASELAALIDETFDKGPAPIRPARRIAS
ncbi:MAG: hypothetical protein JO247_12255 [Chloroflexi bacterium]|nr:hypothetical protein [Chloroflexota bacterium]